MSRTKLKPTWYAMYRLHKIVNHDLIISFPESKPTTKDTMSVMCDSDDNPKIIIYDDWIE